MIAMRRSSSAGQMLFLLGYVFPMNVRKGRKIFSPCFDGGDIDVGAYDRLLAAGFDHHFAVRIDDAAAAEIAVFWIASGAVDSDHIGEIFDGTRFQERYPVLLAR